MDRKEIENKLEQAKKDRQGINDNILWLKGQLAEAEKPKLRHGDVVVPPSGEYVYLAIEQEPSTNKLDIWGRRQNNNGFVNGAVHKTDTYYESIGINIFDLLKEWSEDLEYFDKTSIGGGRLEVRIFQRKSVEVEFRIGAQTATMNKKDVEEIWHKLGQLIATLKRKQSH